MADFCKHCSIELFGEDSKDLSDLGSERGTLEDGYGWRALCESCGPILVDDDGVCITHNHEQTHSSKPTPDSDAVIN